MENQKLRKRTKKVLIELLLALLHTTLILIIVASVLVLIATFKVRSLAKDVAADATEEAIKVADAKLYNVTNRIDSIDNELKVVSKNLEKFVDHPEIKLSLDTEEVNYLNENIKSLVVTVEDTKKEIDNFVYEAENLVNEATSDINSIQRDLNSINYELNLLLDNQDTVLTTEIKQQYSELTDSISILSKRIETLASSNQELTDQTIRTIGEVVTDSIINVKHCKAVSVTQIRN